LSFHIFPPEALYSQFYKWSLKQKKWSTCCGFASLTLRLRLKGYLEPCLEENRKQKCRFASNINRLFRLAVHGPGGD
jgi:hypothetical protein